MDTYGCRVDRWSWCHILYHLNVNRFSGSAIHWCMMRNLVAPNNVTKPQCLLPSKYQGYSWPIISAPCLDMAWLYWIQDLALLIKWDRVSMDFFYLLGVWNQHDSFIQPKILLSGHWQYVIFVFCNFCLNKLFSSGTRRTSTIVAAWCWSSFWR